MSGEKKIVVAIDGYSSCGKSTVAKALAARLHYKYIDSGAMYRAVTLFAFQNNFSVQRLQQMSEKEMDKFLDRLDIRFSFSEETGLSHIFLNKKMVDDNIRQMNISENVSAVSAIPFIRKRMVNLQRGYGKTKGIVMDGRDIGTKVFPNAELKIFMTADKDIRSKRRYDDLHQKGIYATLEEVRKNNDERDYQDTHRAESPLTQAPDAIVLDNSNMNYEEQLNFVLKKVNAVQKKLKMAGV